MTSLAPRPEVGGVEGAQVSQLRRKKRRTGLLLLCPSFNPPSSAMEFPDLGAHCSEPSCKRLDFLPLKCDACEQLFCTDHVAYAHHSCTSAYKKDVQVPVCPLCSTPIPVKRGEMPDIVVGAHIDQDCKSDPAQRKRKIFTNKCQRPGCKQREMMKVLCDQCHGNFCLKHRHPLDHECSGTTGHSLSKAGNAAIIRAQKSTKASSNTTSNNEAMSSATNLPTSSRVTEMAREPEPQSTLSPAVALQNGLTEEEALQRALEMSLAEVVPSQPQPRSTQEEEDLALAQAISASEEEYRRQQQQQQQQARSTKPSNCCLS
ncbi:AN1-type zinc finger protein 2B isoform X2 [Sceloporus undulatus]|uniref:AN1-type zinc finger protein 2B isoform X2 n=1 Tax=Sceloporus undulatus TaxID=8520 RepID=UPI001C4CB5DB|nr:AN1-type zinc finger protein 2B isoform X2 [Sceloporus undulatus]